MWTDVVTSTGVDLNAIISPRLTTIRSPTSPTTTTSVAIPSDPDAAALHGMIIPDVMAGIDTSAYDRFEQRRLKFLDIKRKIQGECMRGEIDTILGCHVWRNVIELCAGHASRVRDLDMC